MIRFMTGKFLEVYDPTLEDWYTTKLTYYGTEILLDLYDTAHNQGLPPPPPLTFLVLRQVTYLVF